MRSMRYGRRGIWVIVCLCAWEFFCDFMCLGVCVYVSLYDMASWRLSLFWVISSGLGWLNRWMSLNVRTTRKKNSFQSRLVAGLGCCPVPPVPAVPTFCSPVFHTPLITPWEIRYFGKSCESDFHQGSPRREQNSSSMWTVFKIRSYEQIRSHERIFFIVVEQKSDHMHGYRSNLTPLN